MTILIALALLAGFLTVDAIVSAIRRRLKRRRAEERLRAEWGRTKPDAGLGEPVGCLHLEARDEVGDSIDEQTWADLDLDRVFAFLDRTESALGREVLYHRLRSTTHSQDALRSFDSVVDWFRANVGTRQALQFAFASSGKRTDNSVWELPLEPIAPPPRWIFVCPILTTVMVASTLGGFVYALLWLVPLGGVVLGLALRAKLYWYILPLVARFQSTGRMLRTARDVAKILPPEDMASKALLARLPALSKVSRIATWIGRDPLRGDLGSLFWEYVNLAFCVDGNVLWFGIREVSHRQRQIREVAEILGEFDAAIAVASVRAGLQTWTRPTFAAQGTEVMLDDLQHPLVDGCLPNSVHFGPPDGVLVTGANMTGKSTFLRTVGVNVVLAQSLYTVCGTRYEAPWLRVRSSISTADDLSAGKSLYQQEVEHVISLMTEAGTDETTLCLFDEMFRGTNSIDRISASVAVLRYLARSRLASARVGRCLVIAATHDLELVALLTPDYDVFHFGDEMGEEGPRFDYTLKPGPATTRNAIALLQFLGAPQEVVADALASAGKRSASPERN